MASLVNMNVYEDYISISFDVGTPEIMSLGEKMNEICDQAYMNGYNWDAFLNSYIEENKPELLEVIESDPEAEMYCVYINDVNDDTKAMAEEMAAMIESFISDEDAVLSFLKSNKDDIEWD